MTVEEKKSNVFCSLNSLLHTAEKQDSQVAGYSFSDAQEEFLLL